MFIVSPLRTSLPVLAGLLVLVGACTKEADRTPPAETTKSTPPSGTQETTATRVDTAAGVDTAAIVAAQTIPVPPPSASKPRVRPSIDPGRKAPAPKPVPAPAAPATDSAAPSEPTPAAGQGQPVKYDASTNTVTFDLIAGPNGFQFNGYASGGGTLTVPPKANVVMNFINKDGTPHSAELIPGEGPLPNAAVDAAIPRAYTNQLLPGLPQEGSDVMRFQVPESGTYRIFCGVPGHGLSGMWIWMKVDPKAKTPSFGPTKS